MNEIFKDIPNYEGKYQVSNLGRVKSLNYKNTGLESILKQRIDKYGYCRLNLSNSIQKTVYVHKLVAMTFLNHKPCGLDLVIDHKNDIKTDNRVENLHIVTQRFNSNKTQGKYSSQYKGVHLCKASGKWISRIKINGKKKYLGCFKCELKAHYTYLQAVKELEQKKGRN